MMTTKKNKKSKVFVSILCIFLALCTGFLCAFQTFGEVKSIRYLSDIKLFYVPNKKSKDDSITIAKAKCESDGYTFLNADLNSGTGKDWVYLGYKTTSNADLAVTDIRLLGMNKDYYLYDYKEILKYIKDSNTNTGYTMYNAANDFIVKYNAGSPKAQDAYKGLNLFYVGDKNTKFGDYILSGKATIDFFTEMIVKASTGTTNAVMNFLNMGLAPFELPEETEKPEIAVFNEDEETSSIVESAPMETIGEANEAGFIGVTWADALANSELLKTLDSDLTRAELNDIHKKYNDDARDVFKQIQDFASLYENAAARNDDGADGAIDDMEAEIKQEKIRSEQDAVDSMDDMEEEDTDAVYLSAYETMNQYTTAEGEPLGDWIVDLGLQTSDEVDITEVYPIIEAMGIAQAGIVRAIGILPAVSNLGENETSERMNNVLPKAKAAIKDYNNGESISLWDNADDDIDKSYIAYTSDAVRVHNANNSIGKRTRFEIVDEKINNVLKWIGIVSSIVTVAVMVLKGVVTVANAAIGVMYMVGATVCAGVSSFFAGAAACLAAASVVLMWVGIAVLAFTIGYYIGKWIASLIKKVDPTLKHANFPDYVFDVAETPNGKFVVKYRSVRDENNKVGDVNARQQENWAALCYTTDKEVGSPILADDSGTIFRVFYGNQNVQNGYDCINFFGERNPANLNYQTGKDKNGGVYVSYRTEQSISVEIPAPSADKQETETTQSVNYISDLVIGIGSNATEAKAKITKKTGKYYIYDYNMSPGTNNYTYLGYSMTNDPDEAITDIRVAPYQGNGNITFGDIQYTFIGHVGVNPGADAADTAGDAILKTKDKNAGSPIPADGIHFVKRHKDAKPGWEPVSLFCGLPYNFASMYDNLADQYVLSCYSIKDSNHWLSHEDLYMYYEPTVKYTGGEKYLAGVYFIHGYKIDQTVAKTWSQTKANMDELKETIRYYPYAGIYDVNLAESVVVKMDSGHDRLREYLCYCYTYNPKRALYDITAFQGDPYSDTLTYSFAKPDFYTGDSIGYTACNTISQQGIDGSTAMMVSRIISPDNAIINSRALLVPFEDYDVGLWDGYTKTLPEEFRFKYEKSRFLPLGLYVAGHTGVKDPLKLDDVVVCGTKFPVYTKGGIRSFGISGERTLDGNAPIGFFRSVSEIKNPSSTTPLDIAYPVWYNKKNEKKNSAPTYIYLRDSNGIPQARYISSVCVGSYSREQYKKDLASQQQTVKDDDVKKIDDSVNLNAMLSAASGCGAGIICKNLACSQSDAWYSRQKDGKALSDPPENVPASYVGFSRTNKASEAITGVLLYQNDDTTTPKQIKIDRAEYYCDSTSSPIIMDGKRYYLYYTRNRGVLDGTPIEDIRIDTNPIKKEYMTALCGKVGSDKPYGDPNLTYFIHINGERQEMSYYTDLYIGKGESKRAALCDLVRQECCQYINMDCDLNMAVSPTYLYLGYSMAALPEDATEEDREDAWYEAIYDIIITKNKPYEPEGFVCEKNNIFYAPVSDINLNYGNDDADVLYMYYCSPYRSTRFNKAQVKNKTGIVTALPNEVFSAPLSKLAFARYDRVPYLDKMNGADNSGNPVMPWEYVMFESHNRPADFTSGSAKFEGEGYVVDNRVTMFAQRYDGSVKPSAEITGGFIAKRVEVGTLSAKLSIVS